MNLPTLSRSLFAMIVVGAYAAATHAEIHNFYVTVDGRPTLTGGTYLGLPNPNAGRLMLLFAHPNVDTPSSNHFHGIGTYSYTGTPPAQTVLSTSGNNRIPEISAAQLPLTLKPGVGPFAGKLVSGENGEHYSDLTLHSIYELSAIALSDPTSPEGYMYNSNAGYNNTPLTGLNLGMEIVAMTPGLNLGLGGLNAPGAVLPIGNEAALPSEPVFWTDAGASPGTYSASLRLIDQSGTFAPSGVFHFDFAAVPEPTSAGLAGMVGAFLAFCGGKRRR